MKGSSLLLFIGLFIFSPSVYHAQSSLTEDGALQLIQVSKKLRKDKQYNLAKDTIIPAFHYFEQNQDWDNWYKCAVAIRLSLKSLEQFDIISDSLASWEKRIPESVPKIKGKLIFIQGYHLMTAELNQVEGLKKYKEAIPFIEMGRDTKYMLFFYNNVSNAYSQFGDQVTAIRLMEEGINLALEFRDTTLFCDQNNSLGKYYFHGEQYDKAKEIYEKTLTVNKDHDFAHIYLAELYSKLDRPDKAKYHLDKVNTDNPYVKGNYNLRLAEYYLNKGQIDEAFSLQKGVVEELKYSPYKREFIKESVRYAEMLFNQNRIEEAVINAHTALCDFFTCADSLDYYSRPDFEKLTDEIWIIEGLYIKANYFQLKYSEENDKNAGEEALYYYDFLFKLFDRLRLNYYAVGSKFRMGSYAQKIYANAISFLHEMYVENNDPKYLNLAFEISQRANSFVLKGAISEKESLEFAGVTQDSIDQYNALSLRLKDQINKESDSSFKDLSKEYEDFKKSLKANYPGFKLESKEYKVSVDQIKNQLDNKTAFLKYFQHDDKLYCFIITKNDQSFRRIEYPTNFNSTLSEYRDALTTIQAFNQNKGDDEVSYISKSKQIYDIIIGQYLELPILKNINQLLIIPDGNIKEISFSSLYTNDSEDWTNSDNYLVSDYAISYLHYSGQILPSEFNQSSSRDGFIGFGMEYDTSYLREVVNDYQFDISQSGPDVRSINISPLKNAEEEVKIAAELMEGTYLIDNVLPSDVLANIRNKSVIHFSVHAFVDVADYYNSFILLGKDSDNNNRLGYEEILRENVNSDLVVLSACQTGFGNNVMGEGLMSIMRAFTQSGCDATMGSYWNAPDRSTKEIMSLFYSNIKKGMNKSQALQQAQLTYLTDDAISSPLVRSPLFWGSWVIYGNDEPIGGTGFNSLYWIPIGLIACLFIFFLYRRKS